MTRDPVPAGVLPAGTRPFRPGDEAPILAAMLAARARGELPGVSRHQLRESADRLAAEPWLAVVAEDAGRIAGWVVPHHDDLTVDRPFRRRGHGTRLVAAGRRLAAHLGLPMLRLWVPRVDGPEAFARATGLRYDSSLWRLVLDPAALPGVPAWPAGYVVRWLEPGRDEPAFVELVNAAFADHPSPLALDVDEVTRVHRRRDFDPSTVLLVAPAEDRARLVAFCRVAIETADDGSATGELRLLGVRREARGAGLGRALVRWGVDDLRRRGVDRVVLSVEGRNEAALALYEAEGFRPELEWPHWVAP